MFKPFGVYAGIYSTRLEHFANWPAVREMFQLFMLGHWRLLREFAMHRALMTIIFALAASAVTLFILTRMEAQRTLSRITPGSEPPRASDGWMNGPRFIENFGATLLVFQIAFFSFGDVFPLSATKRRMPY